ncbi:Ammonium transporter 3 member 1 [Ananas comosus]|uniref:Ammonium transporter 3 member 1 n=1 Tax=Ananas comosus TaxID=4615 RepID=A0A199VB99_ANACO|nr:Ammonium transporter 3 member 1 [Ananas comosus]
MCRRRCRHGSTRGTTRGRWSPPPSWASRGFPGLALLYAGLARPNWGLNSPFMPLYALAAAAPCWVLWAHNMAFGPCLLPFAGRPGPALARDFLAHRALLPSTVHYWSDCMVDAAAVEPFYPAAITVLNTHICAATSLLVWTCLDTIISGKPSIVGAVQGMITGLVCITPAAGLVQGWAALIMGLVSGSVPWYTMMSLSKKLPLLQKVDGTLGILHTHALSGILGSILTGLFAHPDLCVMFLPISNSHEAFYGGASGGVQILKQLAGACFVIERGRHIGCFGSYKSFCTSKDE